MAPVKNVRIGRLALHVSGMTPAAARELAGGVARGVTAAGASVNVPRLRVDVQRIEGESAAALQLRITRAVERALRRG
jgi:hypothetical protein